MNVTMNPTINVTGVSGPPKAIGREVAKRCAAQ
jgi:hypothetical protein